MPGLPAHLHINIPFFEQSYDEKQRALFFFQRHLEYFPSFNPYNDNDRVILHPIAAQGRKKQR